MMVGWWKVVPEALPDLCINISTLACVFFEVIFTNLRIQNLVSLDLIGQDFKYRYLQHVQLFDSGYFWTHLCKPTAKIFPTCPK